MGIYFRGIARKGLLHQIKKGINHANWQWAIVPFAHSEAGEIIYDGASKYGTVQT